MENTKTLSKQKFYGLKFLQFKKRDWFMKWSRNYTFAAVSMVIWMLPTCTWLFSIFPKEDTLKPIFFVAPVLMLLVVASAYYFFFFYRIAWLKFKKNDYSFSTSAEKRLAKHSYVFVLFNFVIFLTFNLWIITMFSMFIPRSGISLFTLNVYDWICWIFLMLYTLIMLSLNLFFIWEILFVKNKPYFLELHLLPRMAVAEQGLIHADDYQIILKNKSN